MEQLDLIQPIIIKFIMEKDRIERKIVKEGTIPKELCNICPGSGLIYSGRKRWIIPLDEREREN